jgi:hypothetical protein
MMSGRKMFMFNRILVGLTGISMHSTSTTLAALQDKQMPDYTIYMVKFLVNKTMQPRRVFRVARWTQVIELRVSKLFENQVFLPSSSFTLLDDSTIIIRFGGNKGGKKMAFKLGLTVMNAPKPNSSAALDLLATMEAFDKYNNLRHAILHHHVEESAVIFNTKVYPVLITIRTKGGIPLLVKVSECGLVYDPLLHDPVLCEGRSCPKFESWIRIGQKARLCYEDGGDVWGIALMDNILVESVIPFLEKIENKKIEKTIIYKEYTMHVLLGGDNEFLHTVCGLKLCSAINFCIHCEASQERLRKERDMSSGILRTRNSAITQPARVNKGTSNAKRGELEKVNGYYNNSGGTFMTKITSQQSSSGRNIIRSIFLQPMTSQSGTNTVLSWRINTRAPLYARTLQRKSKRLKTRKSCRHMRTLPKLFIVL